MDALLCTRKSNLNLTTYDPWGDCVVAPDPAVEALGDQLTAACVELLNRPATRDATTCIARRKDMHAWSAAMRVLSTFKQLIW
jgi:hypothetical protein